MHDEVFGRRRRRVLDAIAGGVMLLPSAPVAIRNNDVEHEYRQDSDVYYLTGFDEPESVLVLSPERDDPFGMFVRPRDPEREVWDGARAGVDGARADFGADEAHPIDELSEKLPDWLQNTDRLYYAVGRDAAFDRVVFEALRKVRARAKTGVWAPAEIVDPGVLLHAHRLRKAPEEVAAMRRAVDVTAEAHTAAMARTKPGMYEYEVDALLRSVFRRRGSERPAYPSIVGSGENATVLHYRRNDRQMLDGDLLLIDAGCELDYYASDITRTFPVNGKFSAEQRAIYEIVLEAQLAGIRATRPGATLDDVHDACVRVIASGLVEAGVLEGDVEDIVSEQKYKPYYMHRTSHYLGMDVHDVGSYFDRGKPRPLEPGMVITIEPGIYIAAQSEAPERFRGIGVRIEDDVLVDAEGADVLSAAIPKTVDDVEHACSA